MIREIIHCLSGCHSFIEEACESTNLGLLKRCELNVIRDLTKIASIYREIKIFIDCKANFSDALSQPEYWPGWYMQAFCHAAKVELLPYENELICLDNVAGNDGGQITLLFLFASIQKFRPLLEEILSTIREIESRKFHGTQMLSNLYQKTLSPTNCEGSNAIIRISNKCHEQLFRQIANWMLNGYLSDPFLEFFVRINAEGDYELNATFIPSYMPLSLANDICYVGKIVATINEKMSIKTSNGTIFESQEEEFVKEILALTKSGMTRISELESITNRIKDKVARYLWMIATEKYDLYGEFKCVTDVYFLCYDFYDSFIDVICTGIPLTRQSLESAFYITAGSSLSKDFTFSEKINDGGRDEKVHSFAFWSRMNLSHCTRWPNDVMFKPHILQQYKDIFSFLLPVSYCQRRLNDIWMKGAPQRSTKWMIWRHRLICFMGVLKYFLHVDCIQSEFILYEAKAKNYQNFTQVEILHTQFLSEVYSRMFPNKKFANIVQSLLDSCVSFCELFEGKGSDKKLKKFAVDYEKLLEILLICLQCAPNQRHPNSLYNKICHGLENSVH